MTFYSRNGQCMIQTPLILSTNHAFVIFSPYRLPPTAQARKQATSDTPSTPAAATFSQPPASSSESKTADITTNNGEATSSTSAASAPAAPAALVDSTSPSVSAGADHSKRGEKSGDDEAAAEIGADADGAGSGASASASAGIQQLNASRREAWAKVGNYLAVKWAVS